MKRKLGWLTFALAFGLPAIAFAADQAGFSLGCCPFCP